MKRKNIMLRCSLLAILSCLFAVGCSGGSETGTENPDSVNSANSAKTSQSAVSESTKKTEEDKKSTEVVKNIAITNTEEGVFVTKQIQINVTTSPETYDIVYAVDNEEAGTISETGLFTAVKPGHVKVTATIANTTISADYEFDVIDTIIDDSLATEDFDYSGIFSKENVSFKTKEEKTNTVNNYTTIKNVKGTSYAFSAKVSLSNPKGDDTWSRVSLGHADDSGKFHGFFVSPGPSFNAKKSVVMDIQNGEVAWGETTNRSQIWGMHDLASLDMTDMTLETIRDGDKYYYFINGELYWYEDLYLAGGDTMPAFSVGQTEASFSEIKIETDTDKIKEKIANDGNELLYPSYKSRVEITNNSKTIHFNAIYQSGDENPKDLAAKSIGDKFVMPANKDSSVTFNMTINSYGATNPMPALAFTINRHEGSIAESRSYVITETKTGFTGWNGDGNLNEGIGSGGKEYADEATLEIGVTYKVTCTRVMTDNGQDTKVKIEKEDGTVLLEDQHGWQDGYSGNAICSFLCRDLDVTLTNIELNA